jgi:hypothetical protein
MTCIRYGAGYAYQLRAGYRVLLPELADLTRAAQFTTWLELWPDGTLVISPGYAWDGASGPTYDSKSSMRASLVHDALYQLMRLGLLSQSFKTECSLPGRGSGIRLSASSPSQPQTRLRRALTKQRAAGARDLLSLARPSVPARDAGRALVGSALVPPLPKGLP